MKIRKTKRLVSIIAALAMVMTMIPAVAMAEEATPVEDVTVLITIQNNTFTKTLNADDGTKVSPKWTGELIKDMPIILSEGDSLEDAIKEACATKKITAGHGTGFFWGFDGLKSGIGIKTASTYEGITSYYDMSGFTFTQNGTSPWVGMDQIKVGNLEHPINNNDKIVISFGVDGMTIDKAFTQSVKLNKTSTALNIGKTGQLRAEVLPKTAQSRTVKWTSSDSKVATVSSTGKITGKKAGVATITATAENQLKGNCKVSVKPAVAKGMKAKAIGKSTIQISWTKVKDASGYGVYRATSKNGSYKKIATTKGGSTVKYANKSLKKGGTYYYKVKAHKTVSGKNIYGDYSSVASAKVK
ncbi:MAG: Ig-like domain-containing protein [Anaerovoracaceae bacterium]